MQRDITTASDVGVNLIIQFSGYFCNALDYPQTNGNAECNNITFSVFETALFSTALSVKFVSD
jgi:hypothetical protein